MQTIKLAHGSGGREMQELIAVIRKYIPYKGQWKYTGEDSAILELKKEKSIKLAFTADSFIVHPIFFPGGNIGDLAFNGTTNDLLMQGAKPLGLALALVIEEGLSFVDLEKILSSIGALSKETSIPIATGDTKVAPKGTIDKIVIATSGVGIVENNIISDQGLKAGDKIIVSGSLGDHGASLLAKRFNYNTNLKSDTKPLLTEINKTGKFLTAAKDPTRGGISAVLNEMAEKSKVKIILDENKIPFKKETSAISRLLGIDKYSLASEGRFVAGVKPEIAPRAISELKKFDKNAIIIGEVSKGNGVYIKNSIGQRRLDLPEGVIVPRIC